MGQFFVVHGEDPNEVCGWFARGLSAFERIAGLRPCARQWSGHTAVAKFPRLAAASSGILTDPSSWCCAAGTFFFRGAYGEAALRTVRAEASSVSRLAASLRESDGMFALLAGDAAGLTLATDRVGSLHVYRASAGTCTLFSTSSLVLAALTRPPWDRDGCREFLSCGTIYGGMYTLFSGISKVEPATVVRLENGRVAVQATHWDAREHMFDHAARRDAVETVAGAIDESLRTVSSHFEKPVFDLTGGFDSRMLIGAAIAAGRSVDTVVAGREDETDAVLSARIARRFGLPHRRVNATPGVQSWWTAAKTALPLCDGEFDVLLYARILDIHRQLARTFDASVNGSAGELYRGYSWQKLAPFTGLRGHFDERKVALQRFASAGDFPALRNGFSRDIAAHFTAVIRDANAGFKDCRNTALMDNITLALRTQRWQGRIASATNRLWPCLTPLLWRRPLEAALSASVADRVRNRLARRVIERFSPELAAIETSHGGPALPLRYSNLHRFWPVVPAVARQARAHFGAHPAPSNPARALWEIEEFRDLMRPASMASRELYEPGALERFLAGSQAETFTEAARFGRLITLELLARAISAVPAQMDTATCAKSCSSR